jgi:hypothetical protein
VATLVLTVAPMLLVFTTPTYVYYNYPPYVPPFLSYISRVSPVDEWVTSDIPWATAWYGDRPSLWLPETIADFDHFHDDVCRSSVMVLSPETLNKPMLNLLTGDQKDWLPFVQGINIPDTFPLHGYTKFPPDYIVLTGHQTR